MLLDFRSTYQQFKDSLNIKLFLRISCVGIIISSSINNNKDFISRGHSFNTSNTSIFHIVIVVVLFLGKENSLTM